MKRDKIKQRDQYEWMFWECYNKENLRKIRIISILELVSDFRLGSDVRHYLH